MATLDELIEQVKNLKIPPPIDRTYFDRLQKEYNETGAASLMAVSAKHGDVVIPKEFSAVKENKPLFIKDKIYTTPFRTFSAFYLHANGEREQDKLLGTMQGLERHLQLIEKEQTKSPDDPVYMYAMAQTVLAMLDKLKIMSDPNTENGLSEYEKDQIKGLAKHFNEYLMSHLAVFNENCEEADEEAEVEVDEVELENVNGGY